MSIRQKSVTTVKTWRYLSACLSTVLAFMMLAIAGCVASVDPDKNGGGGGGGGEPVEGLDPKTDWQDAVKNIDPRLVTNLNYSDDEALWVDVDRKVGVWRFRAYDYNGELEGREARREYVNNVYDYWDEWYTYDSTLYLMEIEWRSGDVRDTVRAMFYYKISNGQLTLTDSKGVKVTFVKKNRDELIVVPPSAGHDARLTLNSDDCYDDCERYYWTSIKKGSGAEFVQWSFTYRENDYGDNYVSNMKIDAQSKVSYGDYDSWYTVGNNKLYCLNFMGIATEYTYSFSNNGNTLTLSGGGSTQTLRKMTFEEFFAELRPSALSGAAFDPALTGNWENRDNRNYFYFDDDGMADFEIGENDYGIYWWYTRNGTVYLLHFVTGSAAKTYAYSISGVTLTLGTMKLYMDGYPPSPNHDERLITGEAYAWLPNMASEQGGYRFGNDGDIDYNIYRNSSSCCGSWHTSGDSLYMNRGPWVLERWSSSEAGGRYTVSSNGNTFTFNGVYSEYNYDTGESDKFPVSVTYTKTARSSLPPRPDDYNHAPPPSAAALGKSLSKPKQGDSRKPRPRDIFSRVNERPASARQ